MFFEHIAQLRCNGAPNRSLHCSISWAGKTVYCVLNIKRGDGQQCVWSVALSTHFLPSPTKLLIKQQPTEKARTNRYPLVPAPISVFPVLRENSILRIRYFRFREICSVNPVFLAFYPEEKQRSNKSISSHLKTNTHTRRVPAQPYQKYLVTSLPPMCKAPLVIVVMSKCYRGTRRHCDFIRNRTNFSSLVGDEGLDDHSPPPSMSPKLMRSSDAEASQQSPLPASTSLKPRLFRIKEPAPHFLASARGDTEVLAPWLRAGGNPDSRDDQGWTVLQHASTYGRVDCVRLLLRHGAKADASCSEERHTVLHIAAANKHCGVVECLVEAGASIEARNAHGNTPLHSAAATGTLEVMSYLLSRSADPDAVNSLGETADRVSGAGPEASELIQEARRQKRARIAQRQALLHLHKLWISGRATPRQTTPRPPSAERPALGTGEARETPSKAESNSDNNSSGVDPRSLENAVAGVAALPEELFRRLLAFCSI